MTINRNMLSELPWSYVDPIAEQRESRMNCDKANAYNDRFKDFDPTPQSGDDQTISPPSPSLALYWRE